MHLMGQPAALPTTAAAPDTTSAFQTTGPRDRGGEAGRWSGAGHVVCAGSGDDVIRVREVVTMRWFSMGARGVRVNIRDAGRSPRKGELYARSQEH